MVGAQHRPKVANAGSAFVDAGLIEVMAEQVDAIRAGQVVEHIAVQVRDGDARRFGNEGPASQVLPYVSAELEWHAIGAGKLQVGDGLRRLRCHRGRAGETPLVKLRQAAKAFLALSDDGGRCAV